MIRYLLVDDSALVGKNSHEETEQTAGIEVGGYRRVDPFVAADKNRPAGSRMCSPSDLLRCLEWTASGFVEADEATPYAGGSVVSSLTPK